MVEEWRFRKRNAQEVRDEVGMGLSYNQGELPQSEYEGYGRLGQPSPGNFEFGLMMMMIVRLGRRRRTWWHDRSRATGFARYCFMLA